MAELVGRLRSRKRRRHEIETGQRREVVDKDTLFDRHRVQVAEMCEPRIEDR